MHVRQTEAQRCQLEDERMARRIPDHLGLPSQAEPMNHPKVAEWYAR